MDVSAVPVEHKWELRSIEKMKNFAATEDVS
jgi:hypothetical protein